MVLEIQKLRLITYLNYENHGHVIKIYFIFAELSFREMLKKKREI